MLKQRFRDRSDIRALTRCGPFADAWYRQRYLAGAAGIDPLRYYVRLGAALGHDPHPGFDPRWYLARNADVRDAGVNPFAHFVASGRAEGRAPHPWGQAPWYVEGERSSLIDFMRERLEHRQAGAVDMLTPDFVAGWVVCDAKCPHVEVTVDGEHFVVRTFEARPDLAALAGRPAFAFLFQFRRRQAPGARVTVAFADGEDLLGSPARVREPRALPVEDGARVAVNIDTPGETITRRIVDIVGWIALPDGAATIDVAIDGARQAVDFLPRADIVAFRHSPTCVGFSLRHDCAAGGRDALELSVAIDGQPAAHRVFPVKLAPTAAGQPPLPIFMHVPKTAGVSLTAAIDSLQDPRALWLYDADHRSITDQLARLSPDAFDDLRIVGGHFAHGIDRVIGRPTTYVTILREPTSFLKSFFFYCKYVRRHACLRDLDIYEALEARVEPYLDNAFTRHFAAVPCDRAVEAGDLVEALRVLERDFGFVGFVEEMDESVARISRLLGVEIPVRVENQTPRTAEAAALDSHEFAARSRRFVRFDEILVARARSKWWSGKETPMALSSGARPIDLQAKRRGRAMAAA